MYDFDLSGKVILLTGATGLLGSVYAEHLAKNNSWFHLLEVHASQRISKPEIRLKRYFDF